MFFLHCENSLKILSEDPVSFRPDQQVVHLELVLLDLMIKYRPGKLFIFPRRSNGKVVSPLASQSQIDADNLLLFFLLLFPIIPSV